MMTSSLGRRITRSAVTLIAALAFIGGGAVTVGQLAGDGPDGPADGPTVVVLADGGDGFGWD